MASPPQLGMEGIFTSLGREGKETLTLCELDLLYQKSSALYSLVCVEAQIADWVKEGGGRDRRRWVMG